MANPKDFTAKQIRTSQLIASGGIGGTSVGMIVYSASISTDMRGGFPATLLHDPNTPLGEHRVGEDVYFFVSGSANSMVKQGSSWTANGDQGVFMVGGDMFVSGNLEWSGASNISPFVQDGNFARLRTAANRVSIGLNSGEDPVSKVKIKLSPNVDTAGTELREDANYQLIIRNDSSTEDRWSGIGFEVDNTVNENTTATILAKRKGNNAQGSLEFYVKTSADAEEIPVQALSLKHDSTVNITGSMVDIGWDPNDPPTEQPGPSLRLTSHHHSLNSGDTLGVIEFAGHQANAKGAGAKIISEVAGGWGTAGGDNRPADLQFWTSPDTNDAASQRMVITKDGEVGIGLDINHPSAMLHVSGNIPSSDAAIRLDGPFGEKGRFVDLQLYGFSDNQSPANVVVKTVGVVSGAAPVGGLSGFRKVAFDRGATGADDKASFSWNVAYKGEGAGSFSHLDNHILYLGNKSGGLFLSALSVTSSSYGLGYNYPAVDPGAQVLILSGTTDSGTDEADPRKFTDTNFFVSGSAGSRNSQRRGTSVFGGDMLVSGTIYGTLAGGVAAGGWVDDGGTVRLETISDKVGIGTVDPGPDATLAVDGGDVALSGSNLDISQFIRHIGDLDTYLEFTDNKFSLQAGGIKGIQFDQSESVISLNNESEEVFTLIRTPDRLAFGSGRIGPTLDGSNQSIVLILSGGGNPTAHGSDPQKMTDVGFFVSGSIGSAGTDIRGASVFGGDMVVSGNLVLDVVDVSGDRKLYFDGQNGDQFIYSDGNILYIDGNNYVQMFSNTGIRMYPDDPAAWAGEWSAQGLLINPLAGDAYSFRAASDKIQGIIATDASTNQLLLHSSGSTAVNAGGIGIPAGTDVATFISGTVGTVNIANSKGTTLVTSDLVVSGTIYGTIAGGTAAGGWTPDGSIVKLTTISDQVGIGLPDAFGPPPGAGVKLAVRGGDTVLSGTNLDVAESIRHIGDTDTRIEFSDDKITFDAGGLTLFKINNEGVNINPDSLDKTIIVQSADRVAFASARIPPTLDGSNQNIVLILSGGGPTSPNESNSSDLAFYVSGSIGSRGTTVRGTAMFGGDVVISGTLYGGSPLSIGSDIIVSGTLITSGSSYMSGSTTISGSMTVTGSLTVSGSDTFTVFGPTLLNAGGASDSDIRMQTANKTHAFFADTSTDQVLILSGGGPTSPNESNSSDLAFYVSGSIGSRGTSVRGASIFGGDVVVSGSHQISGSLSLGQYGGQKEITSRTTKRISYSDIVSSAQIIDQFVAKPPNSSGFRCVKYTIGGKPAGSNDRFFSDLIVVGDQGSNNGAVATSETRVHTDVDSGGSLEFLNETHVDITVTRSVGVITIKIQGDSIYFQGNGNNNAMEISLERLVILD